MVAAEDDQLRPGAMQLDDKVIVEFARVTGWRTGIEDVTGHDHGIHGVKVDLLDQPTDKGLMFGLTGFTDEMLAKMPVGGMKNAHARSFGGSVPPSLTSPLHPAQ